VRAAARFMASQSWCGQSVVRALRPAPERTHDFEIWPRISRNPSNPKPVTLEMCGVSVRLSLWCEARLSGAVGPRFRRLRPLGSRLWIEDTSRASGRCGGYNSSNTHTTQGGVGHNNIASSTNQLDEINTGWHASPPDRLRASGGAKMLSMARNRAPAAPIAPTSCCMHAHAPQTLYHRARMHPIPFHIMGWPWVSIYTSGAQVQG
jgi:hypothetical protein